MNVRVGVKVMVRGLVRVRVIVGVKVMIILARVTVNCIVSGLVKVSTYGRGWVLRVDFLNFLVQNVENLNKNPV